MAATATVRLGPARRGGVAGASAGVLRQDRFCGMGMGMRVFPSRGVHRPRVEKRMGSVKKWLT
jgi:hypothetical protein